MSSKLLSRMGYACPVIHGPAWRHMSNKLRSIPGTYTQLTANKARYVCPKPIGKVGYTNPVSYDPDLDHTSGDVRWTFQTAGPRSRLETIVREANLGADGKIRIGYGDPGWVSGAGYSGG